MSKKGIILGYLFFVFVVILLHFLFQKDHLEMPVFNFEQEQQETEEFGQEVKSLTIEKGEGIREIGEKLKEQGLVKNALFFKIYAILTQAKNDFWPGEYYLNTNLSLRDLIKTLTNSPLAPEKTVTIIEGGTNMELKYILEKEGLIKDDFFATLMEISRDNALFVKYEFLNGIDYGEYDEKAILQGYLFPDTYRFYQETTSQIIIEKMLDNFNQKLNTEIRKKIKEKGKTIHEVMIMASLIEKEAALEQDRRLVSDIFWRRLREGWALESCATINYILGSPKERLSYEDTRISSPYNTYLHPGLPPGPINNPGLASIQAAVEPLENDYCCFLSTPEGKMIFSRTITEHNWNKGLYLK
ncbi:MAG: endolytic transglycosylase MltG [Patescibacteria group bacterium]|jgi:UPF0755 protein|nr:endolytic transglycosylase MltG [Patescibacteria group bacterium]MDD5172760.1 endolytic transglycosylase MltG [Patescibacteria group bacterium]